MLQYFSSLVNVQSDTALLFIVAVVAVGFILFCGAVVNAIKSAQ
jgi:hypothetical protein